MYNVFVHSHVHVLLVGQESKSTGKPSSKNIGNPTTVLKQDYRSFRCKTWVLEPTVRLISWAGNRIEPVGVDYILSQLGFQHARLTVPKWMQRGCMDPLDKLLSVLMDQLIVLLKENPEEGTDIDPKLSHMSLMRPTYM